MRDNEAGRGNEMADLEIKKAKEKEESMKDDKAKDIRLGRRQRGERDREGEGNRGRMERDKQGKVNILK